VGVVKLPSIRKLENGRYSSRRLPIPPEEVFALRAALLAAAVESFQPDVLLSDKHPFGPAGEMRPALDVAARIGARTALGLRDILDASHIVAKEWTGGQHVRVSKRYDRILVYGTRAVFDPIREYAFPPAIADRTHFCGYVVNRVRQSWRAGDVFPAAEPDQRKRPVVLATPGGGEDGFPLLETFIRAVEGTGWDAIIVTGPDTSAEHGEALHELADRAGVLFRKFIPQLSSWFPRVDALVSMGGYNTLAEALLAGTPTICVPRTQPRVEQLLRAEAFSRLGLLRCLRPEGLTPEALRAELSALLGGSRDELRARIDGSIGFDGAQEAARELLRLADRSDVRREAGVAGT